MAMAMAMSADVEGWPCRSFNRNELARRSWHEDKPYRWNWSITYLQT